MSFLKVRDLIQHANKKLKCHTQDMLEQNPQDLKGKKNLKTRLITVNVM